jgi:Rad3-related DNA helicase
MLLTSETGSGKTLAYLLPIMNSLLHYKDKLQKKSGDARIKINKDNEDEMFLNADEIMYNAKKNKRLSLSKQPIS